MRIKAIAPTLPAKPRNGNANFISTGQRAPFWFRPRGGRGHLALSFLSFRAIGPTIIDELRGLEFGDVHPLDTARPQTGQARQTRRLNCARNRLGTTGA